MAKAQGYREMLDQWEMAAMPQAMEAEAAVLGSLILSPLEMGNVLPLLPSPAWFWTTRHAALYTAMHRLWSETAGKIDMVGLTQFLRDKGMLDDCGGIDYLITLGESVPDPSNAAYYAAIVREKALTRQTLDVAGVAVNRLLNNAKSTDVLSELQVAVTNLAASTLKREPVSIGAMLQELYDDMLSREHGDAGGTPTGFVDLDAATAGLHGSQMIIVAGRPAMGKSLFAQNVAEHFSIDQKRPTMIFSLEMSRQELGMRVACSRGRLDFDAVRRNMLSAAGWDSLRRAVGEVSDAPLFVDDTPAISMQQLRASARRQSQKTKLELIVIDYLQLMSDEGTNRQEQVSAISRAVKALAKELEIPVIALSQLNRGVENREGNRPRLSDLRESGAIEQDADVVLMLHRPWYYLPDDQKNELDDAKYEAELIIAKQRNGPTTTVKLVFDGAGQRFKNRGAL